MPSASNSRSCFTQQIHVHPPTDPQTQPRKRPAGPSLLRLIIRVLLNRAFVASTRRHRRLKRSPPANRLSGIIHPSLRESLAGAAIDHLVRNHPASSEALRAASHARLGLSGWLAVEAEKRGGAAAVRELVGNLLVVPEFLGNRAPFADPDARGIVAGLGTDEGLDNLVGLYLAGMCGLGYGARQIIEAERRKASRRIPSSLAAARARASWCVSFLRIRPALQWPLPRRRNRFSWARQCLARSREGRLIA